MSDQLITCLIAVAANLTLMLAIYSITAHLFVRLAWEGRAAFSILAITLVGQLIWIAPALLIVNPRGSPDNASAYALWFGNWIVSASAIVLLSGTAREIPRQLGDSARMDGLGALATWRHAIFPFITRDLIVIGILTVMATLVPFCACMTLPEAGSSIVVYQRFLSPSGRIAMMAAASVLGFVPLVAIFFLGRRR
ncbi:MAG TPA: hypothetical protein VM940_14205 [Chthoniobacterales bacterium]|jgi:ABC-type glycerol-3-phosphate transport system permease component|nr:hypothetical protein [Chthoniobacterales bacterium]